MKKIKILIVIVLISFGALVNAWGRDTSTPAKALLGHWVQKGKIENLTEELKEPFSGSVFDEYFSERHITSVSSMFIAGYLLKSYMEIDPSFKNPIIYVEVKNYIIIENRLLLMSYLRFPRIQILY